MKSKLFLATFLLACAGLFAQNVSLDQAVQTSAKAVETGLPKGAKAAVLTFTSTKQAFSDYIIDEIATALAASRNIQVIDRQHTDAIRKEFNIQYSGDVSDDEVKKIGRQLGAQFVITGSLVDIGNAYRFRVAAINIETAVREGSSSLNISINDPQVTFLLTGQRSTQTANTPSNSGTSKKRDKDPGGGDEFYKDYTAGQRIGMGALNMVFGLGSIINRHPIGFVTTGAETIGIVSLVLGLMPIWDPKDDHFYGRNYTFIIAGSAAIGAGVIFGFIVPIFHHKPNNTSITQNNFPFNFELVSSSNQGINGVSVLYSVRRRG